MNLIAQHPALFGIAAYWCFSALVGGMPPPTASTGAYVWAYNSLHILAGNLTAAVAAKYPTLPSGAVQVTETAQKTTTVVPEVKP